MKEKQILDSREYLQLIEEIKTKVRSAQIRAALSVTKEMVVLYWEIGRSLLDRQRQYKWGGKFIENVALDLKREFPRMKGMSVRNMQYMRKFAVQFPETQFTQQSAAQLMIPWGHHMLLLDRNVPNDQYMWYAQKTIENGWARNVLIVQLESDLYSRQTKGMNVSNFKEALPVQQSDLANEILKDPYVFQFIDGV